MTTSKEHDLLSYLRVRVVCDNVRSLEKYNDDFSNKRGRTHLKDDEDLAALLYVNGLSIELQNQVRNCMKVEANKYDTLEKLSKLALKIDEELEAVGLNTGEDDAE